MTEVIFQGENILLNPKIYAGRRIRYPDNWFEGPLLQRDGKSFIYHKVPARHIIGSRVDLMFFTEVFPDSVTEPGKKRFCK